MRAAAQELACEDGHQRGVRHSNQADQCKEQEYRLSSSVYLDAKGAPVHVYKADGDEEWQELRSLMMQRLLDSACRMIEKKKL